MRDDSDFTPGLVNTMRGPVSCRADKQTSQCWKLIYMETVN